MLEYAKLYEEEVNKLHFSLVDDKKYQYYFVGYFDIPTLEKDEWNKICRVSTIDGIVIGYLQANINRSSVIVSDLLLWSIARSYKEYKVFEKDLMSFILILLRKYPVIQWMVIINNPVRKKYQRFVKAVGGNIVGIQHKCARIGNEYMDEELYEIISSPEIIKKVEQLRDRIKL